MVSVFFFSLSVWKARSRQGGAGWVLESVGCIKLVSCGGRKSFKGENFWSSALCDTLFGNTFLPNHVFYEEWVNWFRSRIQADYVWRYGARSPSRCETAREKGVWKIPKGCGIPNFYQDLRRLFACTVVRRETRGSAACVAGPKRALSQASTQLLQ